MRQSRGRGSKVETEATLCEAEARPSQLKNCLEAASSRGRCLEDYIPAKVTELTRKSSMGDMISEFDSDTSLYGNSVAASAERNSLDMHNGTKSAV